MNDLEEQLEKLVDQYSLRVVLRALSHVCFCKSDQLMNGETPKRQKQRGLARLWLGAGTLLLKVSGKMEV